MAGVKESGTYRTRPRKWPIPPLGRQAFLSLGILLLAFILSPFWGSICVAAIFAFGLSGPVGKLGRKLGNRRRLAAALSVGLLTLLLFFPATLMGLRIYDIATTPKEQNAFSVRIVEHLDSAYMQIESLAVQYGVGARIFESGSEARESIRKGISGTLTKTLQIVSEAVASLPELAVALLVFALFLYVFLAYASQIKRFSIQLHLFRPADLRRAITILKASSYESLVANALVGALQATVITIGAASLGYHEHLLIFSLVFVISYIPFIGAAPVGYAIALLILLNQGSGPALVMAVVATFAGVIDNIARPYFVSGGKIDVHPVLSFAAILGAIGVMGLKGIFIGPVILTSTMALLGANTGRKEKRRSRAMKLLRGFSLKESKEKHGQNERLAS